MKLLSKENIVHGTTDFPIALYQIRTTKDMEVVQYFHWHDEYEIFMIDKGGALFHADSKSTKLYENNIVLLNKNCTHGAYRNENLECNFTAIVFKEEFLISKYEEIIAKYIRHIFSNNELSSICITLPSDGQNKIVKNIEELKIHFKNKEFGYEVLVKAKLLEIIGLITMMMSNKEVSLNAVSHNQNYIKGVILFIQEKYSDPISIEAMANNSNMSKGHFERTFKKHFKMTPFEYLIHFRITKSLPLLATTIKTISEISFDCGFNSFSYYSKCFKKIMNTTPRKYRKNIKCGIN